MSKEKQAAQKYYQCKKKDAKLYAKLLELSQEFTTKKHLHKSCDTFDIQVNEGMNSDVAKHAPKHKTYATTPSLKNHVNITTGVQVWGYKKQVTQQEEDLQEQAIHQAQEE
eukprot:14165310-Ditylum_brightwellii.AAC.1